MINLSLSNINSRSPYRVSSLKEGVFSFVTDYNRKYEIGFIRDYMISDEDVFQFFINANDNLKSPPDWKIGDTIKVVLEEFFRNPRVVLDYICDTSDNRQAARSRKFEGWFHRFANDGSNYTYKGMKATIEGMTFYAAIVIRNDNPRLINILEAVEQFEADFSNK